MLNLFKEPHFNSENVFFNIEDKGQGTKEQIYIKVGFFNGDIEKARADIQLFFSANNVRTQGPGKEGPIITNDEHALQSGVLIVSGIRFPYLPNTDLTDLMGYLGFKKAAFENTASLPRERKYSDSMR
ncbi:MAG TPA: hypothetical protein VNC84_04855 [Gammaproteobacteria bacterium]|jgi:hypothetical protein|nr:hypothetical protein [Gammaproteobacteria bacterium]